MRNFLLFIGCVCLTVPAALAQDPVKKDPKHYKVALENDQVRVLHITVGPHEKTPTHSHPASVSVWLTDSRVKLTYPDGKTEEVQRKAGDAVWNAGVKHAGENLTDKRLEVIQVELKGKPAAEEKPAAAKPATKKKM